MDYDKVFRTIVNKTKDYICKNNLKAMILGISGGIDSTVTAAICSEVSEQTGIPLIGRSLPIKNKIDEFDVSMLVGKAFCNDFKVVYLISSYNEVLDNIIKYEGIKNQNPITNGNIQARLRMLYLYNLASIYKGLVMSTDNQTEYQLGFWTLHGDVGDFNPIFGLWKTEVYDFASYLVERYANNYEYSSNVKDIVDSTNKAYSILNSMKLTPTDGLGISNSDLEQIGAKKYSDVDRILQVLIVKRGYELAGRMSEWDQKMSELIEELGEDVVNKVCKRHYDSNFKRVNLPITIGREYLI